MSGTWVKGCQKTQTEKEADGEVETPDIKHHNHLTIADFLKHDYLTPVGHQCHTKQNLEQTKQN